MAVRLLARRAHSRAELGLKLRRRGYEPEVVEDALRRLQELGYLDDAAFARSLAARRSGQRGRRAIAAELASKGVGRELIATVLSGVDDEAEEAAVGRLLLRRPPAEQPAKTLARLARRGFSHDAITRAWRRSADG